LPIRSAAAADLPQVMAIDASSPEAAHWSREQYERAFTSEAAPRIFLVFDETKQEENHILGFLVAREAGGEWELENLVIAPTHRRKGLGRLFLNALLQSAREQNASAIFLEVRASNTAGRALYENCGFIHSGKRTNYYRQPAEDAVLYRLHFV
jgi:[ribosomal protein S18]-alanine N-acetyltransferase